MREREEDTPWDVLARGVGEWEGDESMPATPWAPDGLESRGRLSTRAVLGGRGLSSDYRQEVAGETSLRSHTLIRWDDGQRGFVMEFTSETSPEPVRLRGIRDGDRLVFEGDGAAGPMRQTFEYRAGEMRVTSAAPNPATGGWATLFEGRYGRVAEANAAPSPGAVAWRDLTVPDAGAVRDFYARVVGWSPREVDMGGYADYEMLARDGECVAGVCHARGVNADLPTAWLPYVVVESLDRSLEGVGAGGGEVVSPPRGLAGGRMAVVRDPAGAALALWETGGGSAGV